MRPQATTWFEVLTPRDHLPAALTVLSRTEAVELQAHTHFTTQPVTTNLREGLAEYREARRHYAACWPALARSRDATPRQPAVMLCQQAQVRLGVFSRVWGIEIHVSEPKGSPRRFLDTKSFGASG